ncbi:MAG: tetratricopeptide repeat protein [Candidatus Taylorbacteria bacterium]|nr:tetratricopeptide repeat protein [Candidatus Taylorbacteria bacterium]
MKKTLLILGVIIIVFLVGLGIYSLINAGVSRVTFSNTQPMYGALSYDDYVARRGSTLKAVDDNFVAMIVEKKGSTKNALGDAYKLAGDYIEAKDFDTAMKRCNQAWLIDHTSYYPYWCYSGVFIFRNDLEQAALHLEKAISMYATSSELYANDYLFLYRDAALVFTNLSDKYLSTDIKNAKKYSAKAIELLSVSLKDKNLSKQFIPVESFMLAVAYFNNGSYDKARSVYDNTTQKYPEVLEMKGVVELNRHLKDKGF